ncbi:hypothetical protein ACCO45_012351 [Purpureocillium lilacinum]|uniref:Uncharacterized protein n=1 Tax=Purpureocillium lilacinum TaxID=33203 RepID=A0ACC4D8I4_PURLI
MPPKRMYVDGPSRRAPKGFVASTYETLTSSENAAVVRSIAVFGAAVTFPCQLLGRAAPASPVIDPHPSTTIRDASSPNERATCRVYISRDDVYARARDMDTPHWR